MYLQIWRRDSTIEDATSQVVEKAKKEGMRVLFVQAEVQTNLFSPQEDVFIIMEVESAKHKRGSREDF